MFARTIGRLIAIVMSASASLPLAAQDAETMPLDAFAMLSVMPQVSVSPDGEHLGVVRGTSKNGDYILEIYDTGNLKKKPVRIGADKMELRSFTWLNNDRLLVNFRILKDTPIFGNYWRGKSAIVSANGKGDWLYLPEYGEVLDVMPYNEDEILVSADDNNNFQDDVVRFNVNTGRTVSVIRGTDEMGGFFSDNKGRIRGAQGFDVPTGSIKFFARVKDGGSWIQIKTIKPDADARDNFNIIGFSTENDEELYVLANNGEDKAGIYLFNIVTGEYSERLFGLKSVDALGALFSRKPSEYGKLMGFVYATDTIKRYYLDPAEAALQKAIDDLFPGKVADVVSRSDDDNQIVISVSPDNGPGSYYLLSNKSKLDFLGQEMPLIEEGRLAEVSYVQVTARDGRTIPAYITKPKGQGPWPAIVNPHGGPWARDYGGYDEWAQLLAHHGYIVIQPQFRGSEGYGLDHWKAGDKEWGLKMQDDVDDAALYLVEQGLAERDKLAIFGWSYGGYSAFAGSMRENNIYQCSVAGAGVSDLNLINAGLHDNPFLRRLQRPTIDGVSPIDHVEDVNIPIFVVHGDYDRIVDVVHSRKFVDKLKQYGKDYKYTEIDKLDHQIPYFSYEHKKQYYSELLDWFENRCFTKQ
jgi:dipeptidyl aminopeptidase/acylaminoacyl peptidase